MNALRRYLLIGIFLSAVSYCSSIAQNVIYTKTDSLVFENYINEFSKYKTLPTNQLVLKTASFFLGKPYIASTLEISDTEKLIINLREFDCTTFVESCLALSLTLKSDNHSFSNYCNTLKQIRYRDGEIIDYSSRLHYVSDWMFEHEKKGVLQNISKDLGGNLENKMINFMSSNIKSYKQLLTHNDLRKKVKKTEVKLNKRGGYYVISKEKLYTCENAIKEGDLVIFSTSISGLDFTHMGIIKTHKGQVSFIHASSNAKEISIEEKGLIKYCNESKKCNGIVILRLN